MINVGDILADDYETYLVKALNKTRTHAILKCVSEDSIPEESYPITSLDTKGSAIMGCDLGNTYNEISFLAHDWFIKYEQQKQRADELEKNLNLINSSQDNLVNELQQALSESNKRADELEEKIDKNKRLHDAAIKSAGILFSDEKQRVDELEKRWSELVDVLKKKYEYYKVRADDESFGPIEQEKWRIAKHELMMVLKIMTDLKRGETE